MTSGEWTQPHPVVDTLERVEQLLVDGETGPAQDSLP